MPMKLSPNAVARVVGVPRSRIERPVNGHAAAIGVLMRFVFRQYYASPLYGAATASVVDVASCRDRIGLRDVVCQRDQSAIAPFLPLGKICARQATAALRLNSIQEFARPTHRHRLRLRQRPIQPS